ncbi:hypothetical protein IWZ01DRAFT_344501 [Phyllosticta capitalensis]
MTRSSRARAQRRRSDVVRRRVEEEVIVEVERARWEGGGKGLTVRNRVRGGHQKTQVTPQSHNTPSPCPLTCKCQQTEKENQKIKECFLCSRIQGPFLIRSHQHHYPSVVPSITIQTQGRVERPTARLRLCLAYRPSTVRHNPSRNLPHLSVPSTRANMKGKTLKRSAAHSGSTTKKSIATGLCTFPPISMYFAETFQPPRSQSTEQQTLQPLLFQFCFMPVFSSMPGRQPSCNGLFRRNLA